MNRLGTKYQKTYIQTSALPITSFMSLTKILYVIVPFLKWNEGGGFCFKISENLWFWVLWMIEKITGKALRQAGMPKESFFEFIALELWDRILLSVLWGETSPVGVLVGAKAWRFCFNFTGIKSSWKGGTPLAKGFCALLASLLSNPRFWRFR